ncbi:MAG: hypothetical protein NUK65_09220, partial [Firmicutes bacterium]|nr:hypothetical protein [Bacillota bacterium]
MRKKRYFQNIYKFEDKSKHYLIDVSLDDYDDVYDNWDPSPFKRRDIEDEFHDFILNSSEDIPLNFDLTIILYLPSSKRDTHKESARISAYQNYYNYALARLNKGKKSLQRKIISSLLFAALFLSVGYFWGNRVPGVFFNVLHE